MNEELDTIAQAIANEIKEKDKEIGRLNNIIVELEIELLTDIAIYSDDVQRAYEIIYDKLKELKQEN